MKRKDALHGYCLYSMFNVFLCTIFKCVLYLNEIPEFFIFVHEILCHWTTLEANPIGMI